jgi:RNA polymerase subunit RPABC4/transcription elongation factor Spt4
VDVLIGWPGGDWQATARMSGAIIGGYLVIIWLASVLWVYRDIRSRTRDPISHVTAVVIALAFPFIGLPVYFVLRPSDTLVEAYDRQLEQEAILSELHSVSACPNCRRPIQDDFMVCAHCATALREPCSNCKELLQFSWQHCPYCATARVRSQPARTAEPTREPPLELEPPAEVSLREEPTTTTSGERAQARTG